MSARCFARDVPRAVQYAVRAAIDLADEMGEVVGGMPALQAALGHDSASSTSRAVVAAEAYGLMRRVGPVGHGPRRLFVVEARAFTHACATAGCGRPRPGRGLWCLSCAQVHRADRAWVHRAVEMAVAGTALSVVAATLSRPLCPDVIFAVASEVPTLVGSVWLEVLRDSHPGHYARLDDRTRQRRAGSRARDAKVTT